MIKPESIEKLIKNQLLPYLVVILANALILMNHTDEVTWLDYLETVIRLTLELSPVIFFKHLSIQYKGIISLVFWLIGFIFLPTLTYILINNWQSLSGYLTASIDTVILLFIVEAFVLSKLIIRKSLSAKFKFKPTLDNIFFILMVIVSLIWSLIFNSIDDPLRNQPIAFSIDLKRNLTSLVSLLDYWWQIMIVYGCLYLTYYINHHFLINKVLSKWGFYTYIWLTALFILIAYPILSQIILLLPINIPEFTFTASQNYNPFDYWNGKLGIIIILLSLPIVLAFQWPQKNQQLMELKTQNLQTELLWLQQQINPHFLFNTLNNLYALCLTQSDKAPDSILQLANLLRFVVYKGSSEKVKLKEEVDYLKDYLNLQGLRVANKCHINFDVPEHIDDNIEISPLLLVIFLENAFKHGIETTNENSTLDIKISVEQQNLLFQCKNSTSGHKATQDSAGIGLSNVKRRLMLSYPKRHKLVINNHSNAYEITLVLEGLNA